MNNNLENIMELFGFVTVMDAYVYKLKPGINYSEPFDLNNLEYTGLCLDTLTVSSINHSKIAQQFNVGMHGIPLIRNGQEIKLTITDALISAKALKLFCGFKENTTFMEESLYLDNYDNAALTIIGKAKIADIKGRYHYVHVVFPLFVPDSAFEFNMSSKDASGLSLNGQLFPVKIQDSTDWVYYYYNSTDVVTIEDKEQTFIENIFDRFDITTVMDVHVYKLKDTKNYNHVIVVDPDPIHGDMVDTGVVLQTLSVSKLTSSAYKHQFTVGQNKIPAHKLNRTVELTMQDALGSLDALQLFYDLQTNSDKTITFITKKQPQAYALYGTTYIKTLVGDVVPISVVIPYFVPKNVYNINMSSSDSSAVFDFSGTIYPSRTNFTNNFVYFYLHPGHEIANDPVWNYGIENEQVYAYIKDLHQTQYITPTIRRGRIISYIRPPIDGGSNTATKLIINTPCEDYAFSYFSNVNTIEINVQPDDISSSVFAGCNNVSTIRASWNVLTRLEDFVKNAPITTLYITDGEIDTDIIYDGEHNTNIIYDLFPNLKHLYICNNATVDNWFGLNIYKQKNRYHLTVEIQNSVHYQLYKGLIYSDSYKKWVYAPQQQDLEIGPDSTYANQLHQDMQDYADGVLYNRECTVLDMSCTRVPTIRYLTHTTDSNYVLPAYIHHFIVDFTRFNLQGKENLINKNDVDILTLNNELQLVTKNTKFNFDDIYALKVKKYIDLDIDHNKQHTFNVEGLYDNFTKTSPKLKCALGQYQTMASEDVPNIIYKYNTGVLEVYAAYQQAKIIKIDKSCNYVPNNIFNTNTALQELYIQDSDNPLEIEDSAFMCDEETKTLNRIDIRRYIYVNINHFKNRLSKGNTHLQNLYFKNFKMWVLSVDRNDEFNTNILLMSPSCKLSIGSSANAYTEFKNEYRYMNSLEYLPSCSFQNLQFTDSSMDTIDISSAIYCGYAIFRNCRMTFVRNFIFNNFAPGRDYNNKECKLFGGFWSEYPQPEKSTSSINEHVPSAIEHVYVKSDLHTGDWSGGAFRNCSYIVTCSLNDSTTFIPANTFRNCARLEVVTIPKELSTIAPNIFHRCPKVGLVTHAQLESEKWLLDDQASRDEINSRGLSCFILTRTSTNNEMEYTELNNFAIIDRHFIIDKLQLTKNEAGEEIMGNPNPRLYIATGFNTTDTVTIPYQVWDGQIQNYQLETFSLSGIDAERFIIPSYAGTIGTGVFFNSKSTQYEGRGIIEYSNIRKLEIGFNPDDFSEWPSYIYDTLNTTNTINNNALVDVNTSTVVLYCNQDFKNKNTTNSIVNTFGYNKNGSVIYKVS